MSNPDDITSFQFIKSITDKDTRLIEKMAKKDAQTKDMYDLFTQRLDLYESALKQKLTTTYKLYLVTKKDSIYTELKIFKFKLDIEEQISQIISRQDELDAQIKDLKKQIQK